MENPKGLSELTNHSQNTSVKPFRTGATVSGLYLLLGLAYIYASSYIAALNVPSKEQLQSIETSKGFGFIIFTALLLFALLLVLHKHIYKRELEEQSRIDAVIETAKLSVAGMFASSIAHDLNNILSICYYSLKKLAESRDLSAPDREQLENLINANDRIHSYTRRLSDISGKHISSGMHLSDLSKAVDESIRLASTHKKARGCSIEKELPESCTFRFDEELIRISLLNMILNSAESTGGNGRILIRLVDNGSTIKLEVHDNGPGITGEKQNRMFEPFFTTKSGGTGLGLLSVRHCTEAHGGKLYVDRSPLGGAVISMTFSRDVL